MTSGHPGKGTRKRVSVRKSSRSSGGNLQNWAGWVENWAISVLRAGGPRGARVLFCCKKLLRRHSLGGSARILYTKVHKYCGPLSGRLHDRGPRAAKRPPFSCLLSLRGPHSWHSARMFDSASTSNPSFRNAASHV